MPTNAPTAERGIHDHFDPPAINRTEFRPGYRKRDRLRKLFDAGVITLSELRAAESFRHTYESAFKGELRAKPWTGPH